MPCANFRFYEELNDFLTPERRRRAFAHACPAGATVKHAIEALGVPHVEVELILVNGVSVGLDHLLRDGDAVSVYPMFEALDVTPLLKLRPAPLRRSSFLADAHLAGLARHLRMLGFDTLLATDHADHDIVRTALAEHRILLSRDRALLMRREVTHAYYVRAIQPREQLAELLARLDLFRAIAPFTRCLRCNGVLLDVERSTVLDRLPPAVARTQQRFWRCSGCRRIYWQGSHWQRMQQVVAECIALAGARMNTDRVDPMAER